MQDLRRRDIHGSGAEWDTGSLRDVSACDRCGGTSGTAHTKGMARRKPPLAASAVDRVVLGPGVKLIAVASTNKAVNSCQVMRQTL